MRWVQACRDQPRGVELVENAFLRALRLGSEVNHGTEAAVETVFATRRRTIDRDLGVRAQNPGDGQNLAFRCALKGENVGVLTFECGEFVFGYRLVAGEETAGQKGHVGRQNYKNNESHNATSLWCLSGLTIIRRRSAIYFLPHRGSLRQNAARWQVLVRADPKLPMLLGKTHHSLKSPACSCVSITLPASS